MKKLKWILNKLQRIYYNIYYTLQSWDWTLILLAIISIELIVFIFVYLHNFHLKINSKESLELILTINGLFSAILITYFFNRVTWILDSKKEDYQDAVGFSQKITEFRRICNELTQNYNVWEVDNATISLLQHGKYKHIDYYDFKLMSFSNYKPKDKKLIDELNEDKRYKSGQTDLFLGMISLVKNRKSNQIFPDSELYKHFEKKGIYNLSFIEKCIEVDYASRLGYWFNKDYQLIQYNNLSKDSRKYILDACERIDNKYKGATLNNKLLGEVCDDMNEHYFKELYQLLLRLNTGLKGFNLLIYFILIMSIVFGVILPFFTYFIIVDSEWKKTITELLIGMNFGLLFFFATNLYGFIKREITWT